METLYIPDFDDMYSLVAYLKKHGGIPVRTEETKKKGRPYIQYKYDTSTNTVKLVYENMDPIEDEDGDREITLMENGKLVTEPWELPCVLEATLLNARKKLPLLDKWHKLSEEREKERLEKGNKYIAILRCYDDEREILEDKEVIAFDEEDAMNIANAKSPIGCYPIKVKHE